MRVHMLAEKMRKEMPGNFIKWSFGRDSGQQVVHLQLEEGERLLTPCLSGQTINRWMKGRGKGFARFSLTSEQEGER